MEEDEEEHDESGANFVDDFFPLAGAQELAKADPRSPT
jgi:hypothetical protein